MSNIKYRDSLLEQLAEGVRGLNDSRMLGRILVRFRVRAVGGFVDYDFSLEYALESLAKDLYWDQRGNWSEATVVIVKVI